MLKRTRNKTWFFRLYVEGIKKYPDAMYLKICYLSNYASSNFKTDLFAPNKANVFEI